MLSLISTIFLPWLNMAALPVPPVRCTSPELALSQQIRQLEESLGVPLFDRSGRTIRLTDAGEVWRQYASRALQELGAGKRAIDDVADLTRGSLRIAVTPTFTSYFIGPLMANFYARYPGITLQLQEMSQEKIEDMLCRDELDVGIAFAPVHSPELEAIPLLTESLALVVAQHHPLAAHEQVALSRLHDEKLVLLSAEFATREQIDHYCEKAGLHPQVVIEANAISAVLELIRRTSLSTLLPAAIATQHQPGLKRFLLPRHYWRERRFCYGGKIAGRQPPRRHFCTWRWRNARLLAGMNRTVAADTGSRLELPDALRLSGLRVLYVGRIRRSRRIRHKLRSLCQHTAQPITVCNRWLLAAPDIRWFVPVRVLAITLPPRTE